MNYSLILKTIDQKVSKKMEFYKQIGLTAQGFTDMMANKTMRVTTLEKISEVLEIPIVNLFDDHPTMKEIPVVNDESGTYKVESIMMKLVKCVEGKEGLYKDLLHTERSAKQEQQQLYVQLVDSEKDKVMILKEVAGIKEKPVKS